MNDPQHSARRLLDALDVLVDEESSLVRDGATDGLAGTQERIGAVLSALGSLPAGVVMFEQIAPMLRRRDATRRELGRSACEVRDELQRIQGGRRRLRELAPAYAGAGTRGSRFESAA